MTLFYWCNNEKSDIERLYQIRIGKRRCNDRLVLLYPCGYVFHIQKLGEAGLAALNLSMPSFSLVFSLGMLLQ